MELFEAIKQRYSYRGAYVRKAEYSEMNSAWTRSMQSYGDAWSLGGDIFQAINT